MNQKLEIPSINLFVEVKETYIESLVIEGRTVTRYHTYPDEVGLFRAGNNIILNGHSNFGAKVFKNLLKVKVGDQIILDEKNYKVDKILFYKEIGLPLDQRIENAKVLLPTEQEQLTLVTCYQGNRYRLVVIAYPEDKDETKTK